MSSEAAHLHHAHRFSPMGGSTSTACLPEYLFPFLFARPILPEILQFLLPLYTSTFPV